MNRTEMLLLWTYAHEAWPNYSLPQPNTPTADVREQAWMDQLGDLPGEAVRRALNAPQVARREWFPPLGVIREEALLAAAAAAGRTVAPDVDEAWLEVRRQISRVGSYDEPRFSHPAIEEAVVAVGWRVLCMAAEGDPARFRQFRDFYALAAARHLAALTPPPTPAALDGADGPRELGA